MKICKQLLALPIIALVLIIAGCNFGDQDENSKQFVLHTSQGANTYLVEIADNKEERSLGLMNRDSLDENRGMLFVYEEEIKPGFWMKNTKIPLDMIFMDKNWKVVDYFENVPPCEENPCEHYIPSNPSQYILEVNAGTAAKIMLARGDLAELKE